ncbi:hypothetical protein FAF44_26475 [Nonomuraea sp. MG754425]|uniref:hypothetical protein n=1 Tax=Nonomuraea sp. MG754425 TaxID=2570319 RepID=UPI001F2697E3|nr:hypothetical protein [Nonomuraea sp. MG754425]MCF6471910.1 hypothetical protein [Nonomuraea sp. MG754425]
MGAWGPALFSDDLACDARDEYRRLIEDGTADEEARRHLLDAYAETLDDPEDGPVFWLALAVTQSKVGRLDPMVRDRALRIVERGEGLSAWADAGAAVLSRRRAVLDKVRSQLTGPQPERRRLRPPWRHVTDLSPGTVLAYRDPVGDDALLRVARVSDDRFGVLPIVSVMAQRGEVPSFPTPPVVRVWVFRRKDPDYRDAGFRVLEGRLDVRPGDESIEPLAETHWEALARSLG